MATFLTPDNSYTVDKLGLKINYYNIIEHNVNKISMPSRRIKALKGITIHNTDWINVSEKTTPAEQYTRACVNGNLNTVRVTYYVDNTCVWQNLPEDYQSWHAADGSGDGNTATLSIECIMRNSTDSVSLKSMDNCAKLTAHLLKKYNLTTDNVYTHTYWLHMRDKDSVSKNDDKDVICTTKHSYKTCPLFIIPQWDTFINLVNKYLAEIGGNVVKTTSTKNTTATTTTVNTTTKTTTSTDTSITLPYLIKVVDGELNVRKGAGITNRIVTTIKKGDVYTIVEEKQVGSSTWGRLKSGIGWINVSPKYCTKFKK